MSITLKEDKSLRLEAFSLHDFVFEVAKAAKSGYSPVDTNDKYVQGFSSWFTCGMVHDDDLTDVERAAVGLEVKEKVAETISTTSVVPEAVVEEEQKTVTKPARTTKKPV